jgi:hypothetical protein
MNNFFGNYIQNSYYQHGKSLYSPVDKYFLPTAIMPYRRPRTVTFYYGDVYEPQYYFDGSPPGFPRSYYASSCPI